MELSKKERLILYNQYEILKHLNPKNKESYENDQRILSKGYKYDYDNLVSFIDDEVSEDVSSFVYNVLQMYRSISDSYYSLSEEEKAQYEKLDTEFKGFDATKETCYYEYACFLLRDLREYEESYQNGKIDTDSHKCMVDVYKRMINRWNTSVLGKYGKLTLENIEYIIYGD